MVSSTDSYFDQMTFNVQARNRQLVRPNRQCFTDWTSFFRQLAFRQYHTPNQQSSRFGQYVGRLA